MTKDEQVARWQMELDRLTIVPRWGEVRRFHSDTVKIARRQWLIQHIANAALANAAAQTLARDVTA